MTRKRWIVGAVVLSVAVAGLGGWWRLSSPMAPPSVSSPQTAETVVPSPAVPEEPAPPPLATVPVAADFPTGFALLQTTLNHAAGGGIGPAPTGADPLAQVGLALRLILEGDAAGAGRVLDTVDRAVRARLPSEAAMAADPAKVARQEWLVSYFELLPESRSTAKGDAVTAVFVRLAVTLRKIDALLLADEVPVLAGYDLVARRAAGGDGAFDGVGLRLPCRLALARRSLLEAASRALGPLAGRLTDCPVAAAADFAAQQRFARDPAGQSAILAGGVTRPGPQVTPLMAAAASGGLAEIEAAIRAGGDPARADGRGRTALHYAVGNRKLSPAERARAVDLLF